MRLRRLQLQAFGQFTGHTLEFPRDGHGFHLIYGSNEAGKSTTLRAVRGLLFGVPPISGDTFLHEGKNLRLAGELLATRKGEELSLSFVRRKGRKNTLLDEAGAPLEETALRPFLGGADLSLFNAMFGLDHEGLREGAHALLSGEGKVGESLFGASVGTGSVRILLHELRAQADQLFTAKGRSGKRISQGIADVRAARQKMQQSSTAPSVYLAQQERLAKVTEDVSSVRRLMGANRAQKERLERQLRVLPMLARRQSLQGQVAELGELPLLPSDIKARRERAIAPLEENRQKAEFEREELERLERRLEALDINEELASLGDVLVSEFSQRLGQYRKARLDLPKRQAELAQKQEDARDLLRTLGQPPDLSACERLRLTRTEAMRLSGLSKERRGYDATLRDRAGKLKEAQSRSASQRRELQQTPEARSPRGLAGAVKRAHGQLSLVERAASAHARAEEFVPLLTKASAALGGLVVRSRDVLTMPVPPRSQLEALAVDWNQIKASSQKWHEQGLELAQREVTLRRESAELQALGELPTSDGLMRVRAERDALAEEHVTALKVARQEESRGRVWQIEETWTQFDRAQVRADSYVDRLREAAGQAAKLAVLQAELKAVGDSGTLVAKEEQRLQRAQERLLQRHQELWAGVIDHPLTPVEMLSWLEDREEFAALTERQRQARDEAKTLDLQVARALDDLSLELVGVGASERMMWETFPQLVERAEATLEDIAREAEKRRKIEQQYEHGRRQVMEQEADLGELKEAAKGRRQQWQKAVKDLGLSRDAGPDEMDSMLEGLAELAHLLEEIRGVERRISGMQRDAEELSDEVKKVLARVLPAALELELEEGIEQLVRQFRRASTEAAEQRRITEESLIRQANVERFQAAVDRAERALADLLELTGVAELSELIVLEHKVESQAQLNRQLADNEADILAQGEGLALAVIMDEARQVTAEECRHSLSELVPEIEATETQLEALLNERASIEQSLAQLEGGASKAAEELAGTAAVLQQDVGQYVRLRMAEQILTQEVERYRAEHQGPVLRAASSMFPHLTLGRYRALAVGFDKKDEQVLQCVRQDGREVPVAGLSDGTRDQLYLSLRLATLEHYLERNTPLPLVLDDILIHFDDDRAKAALNVLGELSRKTQVLFFTHHRRLVELSSQAVPRAQLSTHELPGTAASLSLEEFSSLAG